jgi:uncharacterized RDD family membrane protein YckC
MQQAPPQGQVAYAGLGLRVAAVLVDTLVLFGLLILVMAVYVFVLVSQGKLDPTDPQAAQELSRQLAASGAGVDVLFFAALFLYYALLEAVFGASVGKLVFGMRVVMRDGSRATGLAVVVRNLVRIPEALLLYVPSGVACLTSPQRQRLGDYAARTVVVLERPGRATAAGGGPPPPTTPAAHLPPPPTPGGGLQAAGAPAETPATPDEALARLKTAALAARGAHLAYRRFSERELAAEADGETRGYSEEYVSAWFTLTDAVSDLKAARGALETAAAASGRTLAELTAAQPDVAHLLEELAPYFSTTSDEEVHAAFLTVARAETTGS